MASSPKRRRSAFSTRAIALYVPWPKRAGEGFDRDAIYNGVERIGHAVNRTSGSPFNHHDNISCESFNNYMMQFIKDCREAYPQPSQAIVYICAHGDRNPKTGELHLLMNDSPGLKEEGFWEKSISGPVLREYISKLQCAIPNGKVWILLDCCCAGALFKNEVQPAVQVQSLGSPSFCDGRLNDEARNAVGGGSGYVVFMSCGPGEVSRIDGNLSVPFFTNTVAEILDSFPPGKDIPMKEVVERVKAEVIRLSGGEQNPCEYPSMESLTGCGYGNVGVGARGSQGEDQVEDMEVDSYDWMLGTVSKDIKFIPEDSSPEEVKEYYYKQKTALDDLGTALEKADAPEDFRSYIKTVKSKWKNHCFNEKRKLVLCGQTGAGKSTLINALVEADVLPAGSDGTACTLAVSEVHVNTDDELYKATVVFLSREECEDVLKKKLQSWHKEGCENDPEQKDALETHQEARKDLESMFGCDIPDSTAEMLNHSNVKSYIDKGTHKVSYKKPEELQTELERLDFLHPLIQKKEIYVPTQTVPKNLILVDIPGLHDGNCIRKRIADQQFKDGEIIWVVSNINRALANETSEYLVSKVLCGDIIRLSTLAFICTQNDATCNPKNMESKFRKDEADPKMKQTQEQMQELYKQYKAPDKGKERREIKRQWMQNYARWRGMNVRQNLQQKFKEQKDLGDWQIPVFSISAKDHLSILDGDDDTCFAAIEDTRICDLQKNLHDTMARYHHSKVEQFFREIALLFEKLKSKVPPSHLCQDERQWEESLERLLLEVTRVLHNLKANIHGNVRAVETATKTSSGMFPERIKKVLGKKWKWNTLKATMENNGSFANKKKQININVDLVQHMVGCVEKVWCDQFELIKGRLDQFQKEWSSEQGVSKALGELQKIKPAVVKRCVALFEENMISMLSALTAAFSKTIKTAIWDIKDVAEKKMVPLYQKWGESTGNTKVEQMLYFLEEGLNGKIGDEMTAGIEKSLMESLRSIEKNIKGELDSFKEELQQTLTTKLEGLKDASQETNGKLLVVVETFESDFKALSKQTC